MIYIFYISLLLLLSACGVKKQLSYDHFYDKEMIAKYADIPDTPFQVHLDSIATSQDYHDQVQMFYSFHSSVDELVNFYKQQMERCGWELLSESYVKNILLHYIKPEKSCIILIADQELTIYISKKDA